MINKYTASAALVLTLATGCIAYIGANEGECKVSESSIPLVKNYTKLDTNGATLDSSNPVRSSTPVTLRGIRNTHLSTNPYLPMMNGVTDLTDWMAVNSKRDSTS